MDYQQINAIRRVTQIIQGGPVKFPIVTFMVFAMLIMLPVLGIISIFKGN